MARNLFQSIEYFLTSPDLSNHGLDNESFNDIYVECSRDGCSNSQVLYTNLYCTECTRSPTKVNPAWWVVLGLIVVVFYVTYWFKSLNNLEYAELTLKIGMGLFIGFVAFFAHVRIFKEKSAFVGVVGLLSLILWLMGTLLLPQTAPFLPAIVVGLFVLGFIWGTINASITFCKNLDISHWIPFFVVLPINYVLLNLIHLIPFVTRYVADFKEGLLLSFGGENQVSTFAAVITTFIHYSSLIRLFLLGAFCVPLILLFGILPAITKKRGKLGTLKYILEVLASTIGNIFRSLKPIGLTWWYITRYSITKTVLAPTIYVIMLLLFFQVFFTPSEISMQEGPLSGFLAYMLILILILVVTPWFVLAGANHPFSKEKVFSVYADVTKALFIISLVTVFVSVLAGGIFDLAKGSFTFSNSVIMAGIYAVIGAVYLLWKFASGQTDS